MTPAGVAELTRRGHEVSVQHTAGEGSGFADDDYVKAGARILPTIEAVYRESLKPKTAHLLHSGWAF